MTTPHLPWLSKAPTHRDVTVVPGATLAELREAARPLVQSGHLIQQRVASPLLIDGRAFDVGVYALVLRAADGSLRAHVSDDVLLRFCNEPLGANGTNSGAQAVVVDSEYTSMWDDSLPSLRAAGLNGTAGSARSVLHRLLAERAGEAAAAKVWVEIEAMVRATLAAAAPFTVSATRDYAAQHHQLFELVRLDVVLDTNLKPWLLEVNASPNLQPSAVAAAHGGMPFVALCSSLADWLATQLPLHHWNVDVEPPKQPAGFGPALTVAAATIGLADNQLPTQRRFPMRALAEHTNVDCVVSEWCATVSVSHAYRSRALSPLSHTHEPPPLTRRCGVVVVLRRGSWSECVVSGGFVCGSGRTSQTRTVIQCVSKSPPKLRMHAVALPRARQSRTSQFEGGGEVG